MIPKAPSDSWLPEAMRLGSDVSPAEAGGTCWQTNGPPSLAHDSKLGFEVSLMRDSGGGGVEWNGISLGIRPGLGT